MADETSVLDSLAEKVGDETQPEQPAEPTVDKGGVEAQPEPEQTAQDPTRPDWAPEAFWRDGAVQTEAMAKSWTDTKAELTRTQQALAEAKRTQAELPQRPDEYWNDLDYEALERNAPNAYARGGKDSMTIKAFMTSAHAQGIPKEAAQRMASDYYRMMNDVLPEPKTQEQRLDEAIGGLGPNGKRIAADTTAWLRKEHAAGSFTDEQMAEIGEMVQTSRGLSTLYALSRVRSGGGPPSVPNGQHVDRMSEERDLSRLMADPNALSDDRRGEIRSRYHALYGPDKSWGEDRDGVDPWA